MRLPPPSRQVPLGTWGRGVPAMEVAYQGLGIRHMLPGFPGIVCRGVALPFDQVVKGVSTAATVQDILDLIFFFAGVRSDGLWQGLDVTWNGV